jgi:hypothetical protein
MGLIKRQYLLTDRPKSRGGDLRMCFGQDIASTFYLFDISVKTYPIKQLHSDRKLTDVRYLYQQ